MEMGKGSDANPLLDELAQVLELTTQLQAEVDKPHCKSLAQRILSSVQKAVVFARSSSLERQGQPSALRGSLDSPRSTSASPHSEGSERALKDQELRSMSKKRKTQQQWTRQVRVVMGAGGVEVPLDDGYSWRKYGQKDILGSKHPRGYYRCTHRNSHGCQATKQVQRSDEDPTVFDVTYHEMHTCLHMPKQGHKPEPQKQMMQQNQPESKGNNQDLQHYQHQELPLSFQTGLLVKVEGPDSAHDQTSSSFSFPSTTVSCIKPPSHIFSSPSMHDNCYISSPPPTYISPATSTTTESNYFLAPQYQNVCYTGGLNLQTSESDVTELFPPATSATNSPVLHMDLMKEVGEFEMDFPLSSCDFFQGDL